MLERARPERLPRPSGIRAAIEALPASLVRKVAEAEIGRKDVIAL